MGTRIGLQGFAARPITGWGTENFSVIWNRYLRGDDFPEPKPEFDQAHNKPSEILGTTGILGGITYAGFWLWLFWLIIRRVRTDPNAQLLTVFIGGALAGFLGHLLFLFDTSSTFMLLILLAAYAGTAEPAVAARARQQTPGDFLAPRDEWWELPAGEQTRRRESSSRLDAFLSSPLRDASLAVFVLVVLGLSLAFLNWKPWRAGQSAISILGARGPVTLQEAEDALGEFEPLATYSRREFLNRVSFAGVPEDQRELAFITVEAQATAALEAEPQDLKVRLATARFYRNAAQAIPARRDELLAGARFHSELALELGPQTYSALGDQALQALAEGDLPGAQEAVRIWKTDIAHGNHYIRDQFDKALEKLEELRASAES